MLHSVRFPKYAYETLKQYDPQKREQLLFAVFSYLFDRTEPDLSGWDRSVFALIVADLEEREKLIAAGGASAETLFCQG